MDLMSKDKGVCLFVCGAQYCLCVVAAAGVSEGPFLASVG